MDLIKNNLKDIVVHITYNNSREKDLTVFGVFFIQQYSFHF